MGIPPAKETFGHKGGCGTPKKVFPQHAARFVTTFAACAERLWQDFDISDARFPCWEYFWGVPQPPYLISSLGGGNG